MSDSSIRSRLASALAGARQERDGAAVTMLRATLAAIENAEAVPFSDVSGGSEVPRLLLEEEDVAKVVRAEIDERLQAASVYEEAGRPDVASTLRNEARTLNDLLDG